MPTMSWDKIHFYVWAALLTFGALDSLQQLYMECKLGRVGIEMDAVVANVPKQRHRTMVKHMYVDVGMGHVPVLISGPDYAQKRFKEGQIVKVKYHAASGKATLSGELNWRIIFSIVFFGVPAVFFWIAGYRAGPENKRKRKRGGIS